MGGTLVGLLMMAPLAAVVTLTAVCGSGRRRRERGGVARQGRPGGAPEPGPARSGRSRTGKQALGERSDGSDEDA